MSWSILVNVGQYRALWDLGSIWVYGIYARDEGQGQEIVEITSPFATSAVSTHHFVLVITSVCATLLGPPALHQARGIYLGVIASDYLRQTMMFWFFYNLNFRAN